MRYVNSRFREYSRDLAYRIFITDSVGHLAGANTRWIEYVRNVEMQPKIANKDPNEIINKIKNGLTNIGE